MATIHDPYFKKVVTLRENKQTLQFRVAQDLFSSHEVDLGTRRLLRSLDNVNTEGSSRILDLGCGYGPIGITLKKLDNRSLIHMVDRDALAVEYSRQNAEINGLSDMQIYGSLGYDDITERDFDLIASNIPGKAGEAVISSLLLDAFYFLRPSGRVAIVVVTPLQSAVARILKDANVEVLYHKDWHGHTVFHYRFPGNFRAESSWQKALDRGVYDRERITFSLHDSTLPLQTAYGLPEFNTLSHQSELLLQGLLDVKKSKIGSGLIVNPNQGHIPVALWTLFRPDSILLDDRDLLSLRCSINNLIRNGCPDQSIFALHQVVTYSKSKEDFDMIALSLREEEGSQAIASTVEQAAKLLAASGIMIIAGSSTAITRLEGTIPTHGRVAIATRKRNKGQSILTLRRK